MIPKKIHYCWFGKNPLPEFVIKCIESWKKYCPDYEIIEWNEYNFDLNSCDYIKEAYQAKKWAFVSDYARLKIVYDNGGIYLDTDVELIKSLDELLVNRSFFGAETTGFVATGLGFGAEKNNKFVKMMLNEYEGVHFYIKKGIYDLTPCPRRNTSPLLKYGYQFSNENIWEIEGCKVYPPEFFSPINYKTKEINITDKTYSIHHYTATWISDEEKKLYIKLAEIEENNNRIFAFFICQSIKYKFEKEKGEVSTFFQYFFRKIKKKISKF